MLSASTFRGAVATLLLASVGALTACGGDSGTGPGTVNLILSGYTGVGSYTLGSGVQRTMQVTSAPPQKVWGGSSATNSGSVVITSATSTRIKGTFTATLQPSVVNPGEAPITLTGSFELGLP